MQNSHEYYMALAMEEAERSVADGSFPFAVVVIDELGKVVWKDHDRVKELRDPSAHAEINAIRALCAKFGTVSLKNFTFYTTSEPCVLCMSSCIRYKVKAILYGAQTESTASLPIPAKELASRSTSKNPIEVTGSILEEKCLAQRERLLESK